jgi:hypothetical protein
LTILGAQHRRVAEDFGYFSGDNARQAERSFYATDDSFDILRSKLISFRKGAGISPLFGGRMRFASDV